MAVRTFGLAPSEFWQMDPAHFWWLVETLEGGSGSGLSEADLDDLRALLD